jgi:3-dehydroquinate synthase
MRRVSVDVPGRAYEVVVSRGLLAEVSEHLPRMPGAERAFVVTDPVVAELYLDPVTGSLRDRGLEPVHLRVPTGEEAKTLEVVDALVRQLAIQEAHRDDIVVAMGGGATGDLAGFVAAIYMRGIRVVQIPTTLTAQVDASVGGKTAVNLPEGKNLVGAFHQPAAVLADVDVLATLDQRDYRSGLAEVAKYAFTLDTRMLEELETDPAAVLAREPQALEELVTRCVEAKARTVAADERDTEARLVLNYGHTLGHAIERLENYGGRSHGEAITVGMMFAARLAEKTDLAPGGLAARHGRLFDALGLDTGGAMPDVEAILGALRLDKKYHSGVRFVLLEEVGSPRVVEGVADEHVADVLREMGAAG